MPRRPAITCMLLAVMAFARAAVMAQAPQTDQQRPTFRSAVDLVPVDVNVIDKSGRPVADLAAADFTLAVDGRPRRIASAQFISVERNVEAPPPPPHYSTNAGSAGGRLIMLVVDSGNVGAGRGKAAIDAARAFVGRLSPADRVGLVTIPGSGPLIDFTSNHAVVQSMLEKVVGQATQSAALRHLGLSEALLLERNDETTVDDLVDRECVGELTAQARQSCLQELQQEAGWILSDARERTRNSLIALRYLFEHLGSNDTPKTVVLISEGLLINHDHSELAWVAPLASAAHVTLYVLQLDVPESEASSRAVTPTRGADRELLREGLDVMAGLARGDVFRIVANADFAFQRLALELSGYYLLSFEPEPGDRDGKTHKIKIDVRRPGVSVRARPEFSVGAAAARTTEQVVFEAIRSPLPLAEIPMNVTTYVFQDPDSAKLKILLAAEIDRSLDPDATVALGYALIDQRGKLVASQFEKALAAPVNGKTLAQKFVGAAVAPPGVYTLKVAAVDSTGRRGSVERAFAAKLNQFGQVHATDLIVADNSGQDRGPLLPAVTAHFTGDELHGYIELFSEAPEQLAKVNVTIEIADREDGPTLDSAPARFQQVQQAERRRVAEAAVPIALLPQGDYVARAVVTSDGRRIGQVVRPFSITRAAMTSAKTGAMTSPLRATAAIPFASRIDAFDRSSVLSPQVIGFFLDRLSAAAAADATTVRPALEAARAGRFDEADAALPREAGDRLAVSFLQGLVLLSKGQLDPAAQKFRAALRADSEFLPAAFYLGACYAAGGKDRDAASAWQMSLITEANAPFIYTLLADALLRLHDAAQAVDILQEAKGLWPANEEVSLRLGTALAQAGKRTEAMDVLTPYLARRPDDVDRLFVAMRVLYEAHADRHAVASAEEDRAAFMRYAEAYAAAKGPQLALVEKWRKEFEQ